MVQVSAVLAVEPTSTYHLELAAAAYAAGHTVHLIDPWRLSHYRQGVGQRSRRMSRTRSCSRVT
jgi:transposase